MTIERTDIRIAAFQAQGPAIHVHGLEKSNTTLRMLRGVDFDG